MTVVPLSAVSNLRTARRNKVTSVCNRSVFELFKCSYNSSFSCWRSATRAVSAAVTEGEEAAVDVDARGCDEARPESKARSWGDSGTC
jgi:predicted secreted protein